MLGRRSLSKGPPIAEVISTVLLIQGCMNATILEYEPVTRDLDGLNELHISTYPAGFPRKTHSIPFLYEELRTPEAVFFQVFVRDAEMKSGPNPHINSIRIHSFSYQIQNDAPVPLISDYDSNFWMQDQPDLNPAQHAPVPYHPDGSIQIFVDLTVNGRNYSISEQMQAVERQNIRPLWIYALE